MLVIRQWIFTNSSQNILIWKAAWLLLVWQQIYWTVMYEWTCQNTLRWKTIWLLLMWQEIFRTHFCQSTLRWKTIWLLLMRKEIFTNTQFQIQWSCKNTLRIKTIWLLLIWQEIFRTRMSEYTQIKNHLAVTHVTRKFPTSCVKILSYEKPFDCHSCDKKFSIWLLLVWQEIYQTLASEWSFQNTLRIKTIWLLLMWQEIFRTCTSEYTRIKNHLAASH